MSFKIRVQWNIFLCQENHNNGFLGSVTAENKEDAQRKAEEKFPVHRVEVDKSRDYILSN